MDHYFNEWNSLNFTSLDFETATEHLHTACSVGLAIVEGGKIVNSFSLLIKPPCSSFNPINKAINKISEYDVMNAPEFPFIYSQIQPFIERRIIIAHNAAFDINVLRKTLSFYNIPSPEFRYACSVKLAQMAFPQIERYDLNSIAEHFGLDFIHHDAREDARICAEITIKAIMSNANLPISFDSDEITHLSGSNFHHSTSGKKVFNDLFKNKKIPSKLLEPDSSISSNSSIFYGKKVVFTGDLNSFSRVEAAAKIQSLGGDVDTYISYKTDYVIIGANPGPSKLNKIESLQKEGHSIILLTENDLIDQLEQFGESEIKIEFIEESHPNKIEKESSTHPINISIKSDKLNGMTIVVSGVFMNFSRDEIKKEIEDNGGKNSGSISSKTTFVVAGEKMGPEKLKKARSLNIPVISEEDFLEMIK